MLDTPSSSTSTMTAAWLPADLPLSLHYKSREGGVIAKHWVRFTLLAQLLLILVGFWVGIRIDISHFSQDILTPIANCTTSSLSSSFTMSLASDDINADVDAAVAAPVDDPNANADAAAAVPDPAPPARPNFAALLGDGDPPSLADLTAVKIVMQKHGKDELHWFHRLFNHYYELRIEGPELLSLLSPTQHAFLPDCIDKIRVLLKEHYKTIANLTTAEHMPKLVHFIDDTALHAFNHSSNRFQKLRSPSILTTLAMMTLGKGITVVTIAFDNDDYCYPFS